MAKVKSNELQTQAGDTQAGDTQAGDARRRRKTKGRRDERRPDGTEKWVTAALFHFTSSHAPCVFPLASFSSLLVALACLFCRVSAMQVFAAASWFVFFFFSFSSWLFSMLVFFSLVACLHLACFLFFFCLCVLDLFDFWFSGTCS